MELLHRNSYGIGRSFDEKGQTLQETMGLPLRDYAICGGSFPLTVEGVGRIGAITVSGAPQRADQDIVVTTLGVLCKQPVAELALATDPTQEFVRGFGQAR